MGGGVLMLRETRILFLGTPVFAVEIFEALVAAGYPIVAAVTQPDRRAGRGRQLSSPPLKQAATKAGVTVLAPEKIRSKAAVAQCVSLRADVIITAAYGQLLPESLLQSARFALNVHASLLPRWRGAAPVARAIMAGDAVTGVSIMGMVKAMDAGPVFAQASVPITDCDDCGSLTLRLAHLGGQLLVDVLPEIVSGHLEAREQDPSAVTLAPMITRADEVIDFTQPAERIHATVRALAPEPGAFCRARGRIVKILATRVVQGAERGAPGELIAISGHGPVVACGEGAICLTSVRPEGKATQTGEQFVRGQRLVVGEFVSSPAALST
jgi:methionyl-tRNA formyltransferase